MKATWLQLTRRPRFLLGLLLVIGACLALINFPYGFSSDLDGHFIFMRALEWPAKGYQVSRSWGYPFYELFIYPLIIHFGITIAKVYSLIFYLGSIYLLYSILVFLKIRPSLVFWTTLSWTVLPIAIISGNSILETSQALFLALLGLLYFSKYLDKHKRSYLIITALGLGLATSSRPDYLFFSVAVAITILVFSKPGIRNVIYSTVIWLSATLGPFAIYRRESLSWSVVLPDPILTKILRAGLGYIDVIGIPAAIVLFYWLIRKFRKPAQTFPVILKDPIYFLAFISLLLYTIRYVFLPDELEYVIILVPLLLLCLAHANLSVSRMVLLCLVIVIPDVVQLYLFSPDQTGKLYFSPGISSGAIVQDRNVRLRLDYFEFTLMPMMASIQKQENYPSFSYLPSYTPDSLVIIPEDQLRFYDVSMHGDQYVKEACSQTIMVYPFPSYRGWRQFVKMQDWHSITTSEFRKIKLAGCS